MSLSDRHIPQRGVAGSSSGGLLLVGEDDPGSLLEAVRDGLAQRFPTTVVNPRAAATALIRAPGISGKLRRRIAARGTEERLFEAVDQLRPDVTLLIKGRGISAATVRRLQSLGSRIACWYPDNPLWRGTDPLALERLIACDLPILWSRRQGELLRPRMPHVAVLPFGYHAGWFRPRPADGARGGIAFLGTWSPRRERFLGALADLPLTVAGSGWTEHSSMRGSTGPIVEATAGEILGSAAIGVNLLHPQCAGAHNMRTREISACGALQVTEPGEDGTPLRDGLSCRWFSSPQELRSIVDAALEDPDRSARLAAAGQELIAGETYDYRSAQLARLCAEL